MLSELDRSGTLLAVADGRESHYGFGTHHVRIELVEPLRPFGTIRSTARTRAARRAAIAAFTEADLSTSPTYRDRIETGDAIAWFALYALKINAGRIAEAAGR